MWVVVVEIMENYANAADISPRDKTWMASFGGTQQQQKLKAPAEHDRRTENQKIIWEFVAAFSSPLLD